MFWNEEASRIQYQGAELSEFEITRAMDTKNLTSDLIHVNNNLTLVYIYQFQKT